MEIISQPIAGAIPPVRIDETNGDGRILAIVDWEAIAQSLIPPNAVNVNFKFVLEYLTLTNYFPTLLKVPSSSLPIYDRVVDTEVDKAAKTVEFKRKFNPSNNYSVQFLLWHWWNGNWQSVHFDRDTRNNLGLEDRIGLIKPYLVTVGDTVFGDRKLKLGISIAPRPLRAGDFIEIHGGYSGEISYLYSPDYSISESVSDSVVIGNSPVRILPSRPKRAILYLSNNGETRLYFKFTNNGISFEAETSPFLEPGESLSYEHGQIIYPGGGEKYMIKNPAICTLGLWAIRSSGTGKAVYQELVFNN